MDREREREREKFGQRERKRERKNIFLNLLLERVTEHEKLDKLSKYDTILLVI